MNANTQLSPGFPNPALANAAALVGRILLAVIFIKSGWGKIGGFESTAGYMASKGLPMVQVLLVLTILVELGAGLLLAVGFKARWAALAIFAFLVPVTLIFHPYSDPAQVTNFLKNVAIMGGMLMVFAFGPGAYSVDKR